MTLAVDLAIKPQHKQAKLGPIKPSVSYYGPCVVSVAPDAAAIASGSKMFVLNTGISVKNDNNNNPWSDTQNRLSPDMTKPIKWHVPQAKTQVSLGIRSVWSVFTVHMKKAWVLSYPLSAQRRLWSVLVDGQADMSLRWAHVISLVLSWGGSE